jgi:hypothetical protein
VRRFPLVAALSSLAIAALLALAGCAASSAPSAASHVKTDLAKATPAVLKFLAANTASDTHPTVSSLKKYGFTPSKYTKHFEYFSNSAGVRYCIQAATPAGVTYIIYIKNNSKFSSAVAGTCVAGTNY